MLEFRGVSVDPGLSQFAFANWPAASVDGRLAGHPQYCQGYEIDDFVRDERSSENRQYR